MEFKGVSEGVKGVGVRLIFTGMEDMVMRCKVVKSRWCGVVKAKQVQRMNEAVAVAFVVVVLKKMDSLLE